MLLVMTTPPVGEMMRRHGDPRTRRPASDSGSASSGTGTASASASPSAAEPRRQRRPRCRWSAAAKLPKMNNSERGKFYRKKYKDYERQLERDVLTLRARVRELALLAELRRRLRDELGVLDAAAVASASLERLDALKAGADAPDAPLVQWVGRGRADGTGHVAPATATTTITRFELAALATEGSADAPVVRMEGRLHLFRIPSSGEQEEEELAAYPCAYRLLFSADCACHELLADVDVVDGLCAPLRRLDLVAHAARRVPESGGDRQDLRRVTASLASASLKGRLPGVRQLLRVAAQHSDGYSSAGAVGTDSASSHSALHHSSRRRSVEAPARLMSAAAAPVGIKAEPVRLENERRWPLLRLGKRQRAMTMDYILS